MGPIYLPLIADEKFFIMRKNQQLQVKDGMFPISIEI